MKPSPLQREAMRQDIEEREFADSIQRVVDGNDLDHGRCSRLEFLATSKLFLDYEDIDCLLQDGDEAEQLREQIDAEVRALTRDWLEHEGREWLAQRVEELLEDEIEASEETS